jgi:hypothetical protein
MESAKEFIKRKEIEYKKERDKQLKFKDIGRKGKHIWIREAWVFMIQSNYPEKVFVFERLRGCKPEGKLVHNFIKRLGNIEYRIGYYIVGKIGHMNGKWAWGQYCPLIPKKDFDKLIRLANQKGVIK